MVVDLATFTRPPRDPLYGIVEKLILDKYRNTERHLQVALGPSEIGVPCTRQLAYNTMHMPAVNQGDPLPSIVGTAAHTWMFEACMEANRAAGDIIWIPESVVHVNAGLTGHSDAYHVKTRTVLDWKFPGVEPMRKYRANNNPGEQYRIQGHCYGKGYVNAGLQVDTIAIVMLPRGGHLFGKHGMFIWSEPFDMEVADVALKRYHDVTELAVGLEMDEHPERFALFPKTHGDHCRYCDWFKPSDGSDPGGTCPGYSTED
jgi:hypothetical protein